MKSYGLFAILFCIILFSSNLHFAIGGEHYSYDRVIVYGSMTCSNTSVLRNFLLQQNIEYTFKDIDNHQGARNEMWEAVSTSSWYTGGRISLPIVDINHTIFEHPDKYDLLMLIDTGDGAINSNETGTVAGRIAGSSEQSIVAEIDLVRVLDSVEYWHVCRSNSQGVFTCNGVLPGQYKIVIRHNRSISDQAFLNTFFESGQIYSVVAQENLDIGVTNISDIAMKADFILPYNPYPGDIYWNSPNDQDSNFIYFLTYGSLWSVNTLDGSVKKLLYDSAYMNDIQCSSTQKIIATLSQTNRKMYVIDINPASETFQDVIKTVENLPNQPINLQFNSAGDMAYVACNGGQSIAVVELSSGSITTTISLPGFTQDIVINESEKRAYAGVYSGLLSPTHHQLSVIDLDSQSPTYMNILKSIPIGNDGSFSQHLNFPFIYSTSRVGVEKINLTTDAVESLISTNTLPQLSFNNGTGTIYYIDYDNKLLRNHQIKVFDIDKGKVIQAELLPPGPIYYKIYLSDDQSTLIINSTKKEIYSFHLKANGTVDFFATDTEQFGSLTVNISPTEAATAGAQWSVDGTTYSSGETVSLASGTYTIGFTRVTGYDAPADQSVTISAGGSESLTGTYKSTSQADSGDLTVTISPNAAVTAGAKWTVNGASYGSGQTVSLEVGTYTVGFTNITEYDAPASDSVNISSGGTHSLSGTYTEQQGSLTVAISPTDAVAAGAQWSVNGANYSNGATASLASGTYTVSFTPATGYDAPADQSVTISAGDSESLTGTYTESPASLTVTLYPTGALAAGAQWQVNGSIYDSSQTVSLAPGSYTVSFAPVTDYDTPTDQPVILAAGGSESLTGTYMGQTGSLTVAISPAEVIAAGAQWSIDGGATWNNSGATLSGLSVGGYTIGFKSISGWGKPVSATTTVENGRTASAGGTYTSETGSLTVTITPQDALNAGAQWSVDGGATWRDSGATLSDLAPGEQAVIYKELNMWDAPADERINVTAGETTTALRTYSETIFILSDVVSILQMLSGIIVQTTDFQDPSGNGATGIEDAIYILRYTTNTTGSDYDLK